MAHGAAWSPVCAFRACTYARPSLSARRGFPRVRVRAWARYACARGLSMRRARIAGLWARAWRIRWPCPWAHAYPWHGLGHGRLCCVYVWQHVHTCPNACAFPCHRVSVAPPGRSRRVPLRRGSAPRGALSPVSHIFSGFQPAPSLKPRRYAKNLRVFTADSTRSGIPAPYGRGFLRTENASPRDSGTPVHRKGPLRAPIWSRSGAPLSACSQSGNTPRAPIHRFGATFPYT